MYVTICTYRPLVAPVGRSIPHMHMVPCLGSAPLGKECAEVPFTCNQRSSHSEDSTAEANCDSSLALACAGYKLRLPSPRLLHSSLFIIFGSFDTPLLFCLQLCQRPQTIITFHNPQCLSRTVRLLPVVAPPIPLPPMKP
jgi:hypothetical protein